DFFATLSRGSARDGLTGLDVARDDAQLAVFVTGPEAAQQQHPVAPEEEHVDGDGIPGTHRDMVAWATTKFLGQPFKRLDDARVLRGQATFLEDLRLAGVHHVAFVRSIHAHARFRVDASAARAVDGGSGGSADAPVVFVASGLTPATGVSAIPGIIDHPSLRP